MLKKILIFLTVGIAITSAGRIRREEQVDVKTLLEGGLNIAQEGVKKLEEIASNLISANSTDELLKQGNTILDQVKTLASGITETTKEWSDNISNQELRDIANNALMDFKNEHPNLTTAVAGSVESLNKVANDIIVKLKLLVDDKDVKEIQNTLIDTTSAGVNIIKEQVKEATDALAEQLKKEAVEQPK